MRCHRTISVVAIGLSLLGTWCGSLVAADEPLHVEIDQRLAAGFGDKTPAGRSTDAAFARRLYLDLAGRIPTRRELATFLANTSPGKRTALIDELLNSPDYARRMQELFNAMLMERRGEHDEWTRFLRHAFERNAPWDQMARSILAPNADDEASRGAAYFFTSRLVSEGAMAPVDVPGLTRDVGRLLAGVDLACAQCHDHISIEDYRQIEFQGLHMIFENVQNRRDVKFPAVSEKLMTAEKEFMSVFLQEPRTTNPRAPGAGPFAIETFPKGEEYSTPPDRKTRSPGVPKFSPLRELAGRLTAPDNELFSRNFANRVWFVMMGRGLVEPLDLHHSDNPATHPDLLKLLASRFSEHGFDIKWLLREIALTEAYQRTSRIPESLQAGDATQYLVANQKRLSAEQIFWSVLTATEELERQNSEPPPHEPMDETNTVPQTQIERLVASSEDLAKLKKAFLKAFANPPKEPEVDFTPTVKGALFLMHDEHVLELLQPKKGNLVARLVALEDSKQIAHETFLTVLSRPAEAVDIQEVATVLDEHRGNRRAEAISQLVWAMLTSTEFATNH